MTHASTFAGIGGFDLAAEKIGWTNKFHCEINHFGQQILKYYFPKSISYGDIKQTDFTIWRNIVDVLSGGFPCQDNSRAKQWGEGQQGLKGTRTGLFWHMLRAVEEIRPKVAVTENVEDILKVNGGGDFKTILSELARLGYNAEWRICRASDVGAPHHRARMYLVAYSNSIRLSEGQTFFSHVHQTAQQIPWLFNGTTIQTFRGGAWSSEPPALCLDDGFSGKIFGLSESQYRKQQIMAYGNAVVPEIPYLIFKGIQEIITNYKI